MQFEKRDSFESLSSRLSGRYVPELLRFVLCAVAYAAIQRRYECRRAGIEREEGVDVGFREAALWKYGCNAKGVEDFLIASGIISFEARKQAEANLSRWRTFLWVCGIGYIVAVIILCIACRYCLSILILLFI
jgi:hypothetical protein